MVKTPNWPVDRFRTLLDRVFDTTGLTQAGLAALVSMDPSQISRWKSGASRPKFEGLIALGEILAERYPTLDVGPSELTSAAGYAVDAQPVIDTEKARAGGPQPQPANPISPAEQAGLDAVDLIRQAMRAELAESERRQRAEREAEISALRQEIRELRQARHPDGSEPEEGHRKGA